MTMSPATFLEECQHTEINELVSRLGGWDAVFAGWRALDAASSQFADVWEMSNFLFQNSEVLAERMGVDESVVLRFASIVHTKLVLDDMEGAQDLLESFCSDTAGAYEAFAAQNPSDVDAEQLGMFWRSWADGFGNRAPRVAPGSVV